MSNYSIQRSCAVKHCIIESGAKWSVLTKVGCLKVVACEVS